MRRPAVGALVSLAAVLCVQASVRAGVPELVSFQARLTDPGGVAIDGATSITFRIYDVDAAAVGAEIWTDTISATVTDGYLTVILGQDTIALGLAFDTQYWLGIEIESDGEMTPRFKLAAAPYALRAKAADLVDWADVAGKPAVGDIAAVNVTGPVTGGGTAGDVTIAIDQASASTDGYLSSTDWADFDSRADGTHNHDAADVATGALSTDRYSAYADLTAEAYLDNVDDTDLLTRVQMDVRYVNEAQADSVTSAMIVDGAVGSGDLADGAALAEILDDDGAGSGLDADLLDGEHASAFWRLGGNAVAAEGTLGCTSNFALNVIVNGQRALRLEPETALEGPNVIAGYSGNSVTAGALGATISGGGDPDYLGTEYLNLVTDNYGTVGGGLGNQAGDADVGDDPTTAPFATVGGGRSNTASGLYATVGGGSSNTASVGIWATVGGGSGNIASNQFATIGGGELNTASGNRATVPGGSNNTALGDYSFAAGLRAKANHIGAFVWGDSTVADVTSERNNQFRVRANGGARFDDGARWVNIRDDGTDLITTSTGAHLTIGGVWTDNSDRDLKENFAEMDGEAVLGKVVDLPVTVWNYKAEGESVKHIGPTAQDFHAAFGVGNDDRHIAALDTSGVALAAAKALGKRTTELKNENAVLKKEIAELRKMLEALAAESK